MPESSLWISIGLALLLSGCGGKRDTAFEDIAAREIKLPDGAVIRAEVKADRQSQAVGMMYRDTLSKDRGMLFVYRSPLREPYWMHNCRIALDIIWLDKDGTVKEIVPEAPPCEKPAAECPSYGGHEAAWFVLELAAGQAKAHGIRNGSILRL